MTKTTNEPTQEFIERCQRAVKNLQDLSKKVDDTEAARLLGKAEGVKLARDYAKETLSTLEAAVEERDETIKKLRTCLEDINGWLKRTGRTGTAHQTYADEVLAETAPKVQSEEANNGNAK